MQGTGGEGRPANTHFGDTFKLQHTRETQAGRHTKSRPHALPCRSPPNQGHLKTVIILTGGCLLFGDSMPAKKLLGVGVAMSGIVWYTHLQLKSNELISRSGPEGEAPGGKGGSGGSEGGGGKCGKETPVDENDAERQDQGVEEALLPVTAPGGGGSTGGVSSRSVGGGGGKEGPVSVVVHGDAQGSPLRGRSQGNAFEKFFGR